ncbi:MAG: hypothetical protein ABR512_02010 [Desulfopila sp.]
MYENDLKYCPLCRDEYRAEIIQCAACGVELVSGEEMRRENGGLAEEQGDSAVIEEGDTLVALRKGSLLDMKGLKNILAGAGIPAELIRDDSCQSGGCCGGPELVLQVRRQDGQKALALLQKEYERTTGLADMEVVEAVFDPEAAVAVCPACAHEFTPDRPDCPDCGLHFLS